MAAKIVDIDVIPLNFTIIVHMLASQYMSSSLLNSMLSFDFHIASYPYASFIIHVFCYHYVASSYVYSASFVTWYADCINVRVDFLIFILY